MTKISLFFKTQLFLVQPYLFQQTLSPPYRPLPLLLSCIVFVKIISSYRESNSKMIVKPYLTDIKHKLFSAQ